MATERKVGWIRTDMTLSSAYETENNMMDILELVEEVNKGKVLRALVRVGVKIDRASDQLTSATGVTTVLPGGPPDEE